MLPNNPNPAADGPRLQFVNADQDRPPSPRDLAMTENPPIAAAEAILHQCRPYEALERTGPRTAQGKANSAKNSYIHGCTAKKHGIADQAEIQAIGGFMIAEIGPESELERASIDRGAEALFMYNKCTLAIQELAVRVVDEHKAGRRRPFEEEIVRLEASLEIWEDVKAQAFPFGKGYGSAYPILLRNLDPASNPKNVKDPRAQLFAYRHEMAQASPRMLALHAKFRGTSLSPGKDAEFDEYMGGKEAIDQESRKLASWAMTHVMDLRSRLDKTKRDLAHAEAQPLDQNLLLLTSDEYRKLKRYQDEHERSYYRNMKGFEAHRRLMMTAYDRRMQKVKETHPVSVMVGPLGIHLPKELWLLSPYDQLEAIVQILVREQRYFDRSSRNECRESAAKAKASEVQGITAASWPHVDSADGINPRIIGGETALRPAPGAPTPPDGPDSPR